MKRITATFELFAEPRFWLWSCALSNIVGRRVRSASGPKQAIVLFRSVGNMLNLLHALAVAHGLEHPCIVTWIVLIPCTCRPMPYSGTKMVLAAVLALGRWFVGARKRRCTHEAQYKRRCGKNVWAWKSRRRSLAFWKVGGNCSSAFTLHVFICLQIP